MRIINKIVVSNIVKVKSILQETWQTITTVWNASNTTWNNWG